MIIHSVISRIGLYTFINSVLECTESQIKPVLHIAYKVPEHVAHF